MENGTITLIGATTENPSFSLNNALLSRCRVVVMDKLTTEDVMVILKKAIEYNEAKLINTKETVNKSDEPNQTIPRYLIEEASLQWLAEMCDGDARVALSALELALNARDPGSDVHLSGPAVLTHDDIKDGIKVLLFLSLACSPLNSARTWYTTSTAKNITTRYLLYKSVSALETITQRFIGQPERCTAAKIHYISRDDLLEWPVKT